MPDSTYAIVQLNGYINLDGSTVNATLFPKVPIEAVVKSVNEMDTPIGDPATVIQLVARTDTAPTPTAVGQKYFNTTDRKIHTAVQGSTAVEWDAGTDPVAGKLYLVNEPIVGDTLYVKSVDEGGINVEVLGLSAPSITYSGPFSVLYTTTSDMSCTCALTDGSDASDGGSGYVYIGTTALKVPKYINIAVANGAAIWLYIVVAASIPAYVISNDASYTPPLGTLKAKLRIATNKNGTMVQCHYGDVVIGSLA